MTAVTDIRSFSPLNKEIFLSVELEKDPSWRKDPIWERWKTSLRIIFHNSIEELLVPLIRDKDGGKSQKIPITHVCKQRKVQTMSVRLTEKELRKLQVKLTCTGPGETSIYVNLILPEKIKSGRYSLSLEYGLCARIRSTTSLFPKKHPFRPKKLQIIQSFLKIFGENVTSTINAFSSYLRSRKVTLSIKILSPEQMNETLLSLVERLPDKLIVSFTEKITELKRSTAIKSDEKWYEEMRGIIHQLLQEVSTQQLVRTMNSTLRSAIKGKISQTELLEMGNFSREFAKKVKNNLSPTPKTPSLRADYYP